MRGQRERMAAAVGSMQLKNEQRGQRAECRGQKTKSSISAVISNPGIPGEKSLNLKQISPSAGWRVEMTQKVNLSSERGEIPSNIQISPIVEMTRKLKSVLGTRNEEKSLQLTDLSTECSGSR